MSIRGNRRGKRGIGECGDMSELTQRAIDSLFRPGRMSLKIELAMSESKVIQDNLELLLERLFWAECDRIYTEEEANNP